MIEAVIARIQDRGYEVHVLKGILLIRKKIGEEILSIGWAIDPVELRFLSIAALFAEADHYCSQVEQAISERRQPA